MLRISIITVCYNSEKTIEKTIQSVIAQRYGNIEYIIIDGNSSDKTKEIISLYRNKIAVYISEKDNGIYDAMNKGVKNSTGDIIGFINSDDYYSSEFSVDKIMQVFNNQIMTKIIYSDLKILHRNNPNKVLRYWKSSPFKKISLEFGWMPAHPTFYCRKALFENLGVFDTEYKIAADYELMIRYLKHVEPKNIYYLPEVLVFMLSNGKSSNSLKAFISSNIEAFCALKKNGFKFYFMTIIMKPLRKVLQFSTVLKIFR